MKPKKAPIRADMEKILSSLDERWVSAASRELNLHFDRLLNSEVGKGIHCILAWTRFFPGEVDLSSFIVSQLEKREVFLPRSLPDRSMSFISIGKNWQLEVESGVYGIPEPKDSTGSLYKMERAKETLVIVPGIAFDKAGNRLGRGKGYYDRFLGNEAMSAALKIGVCWSLQLVEAVPTSEQDIPMEWICTEEGALRAGEFHPQGQK